MGRVLIAGGNPSMAVPVPGIAAGDLAVGSSVYLMENGTAVEYLVVNQGKPSGSSLYDDSCNGTWLLRKDIYETRVWHSSAIANYADSTIHSYLNSTFFNRFDTAVQKAIKQVKIPYYVVSASPWSRTFVSGANGLSAKVFLLLAYEAGHGEGTYTFYDNNGAVLEYFQDALDVVSDKHIAYLNGSAVGWWTRYPSNGSTQSVAIEQNDGGFSAVTDTAGVRPAVIIPQTATFDQSTLVLKGGA